MVAWVGERVAADYGVMLRHVKLSDTAEAVSRVLAEKTAGRTTGGSIDLIWINGENFAAMKRNGLLHGPFAEALPNFRFVDVDGKPTTRLDFTEPTDGLEAPWGMAKLVFMVDTARVAAPPTTLAALSAWAKANPGRFAYPAPPDFIGSTFLKQALHSLTADAKLLAEPVGEADYDAVTRPLWRWLDGLHPSLWRGGENFPRNAPAMRQLLDDGELDFSLSFNPGEASSLIAQGLLAKTVRTFVLAGGTIANTHFVAIPFNSAAKEGAMVVANFLMSPEAQARKQDPRHWGDPTVLSMTRLDAADRGPLRGSAARRRDAGAGRARAGVAGTAPELDDGDRGRLAPPLRALRPRPAGASWSGDCLRQRRSWCWRCRWRPAWPGPCCRPSDFTRRSA